MSGVNNHNTIKATEGALYDRAGKSVCGIVCIIAADEAHAPSQGPPSKCTMYALWMNDPGVGDAGRAGATWFAKAFTLQELVGKMPQKSYEPASLWYTLSVAVTGHEEPSSSDSTSCFATALVDGEGRPDGQDSGLSIRLRLVQPNKGSSFYDMKISLDRIDDKQVARAAATVSMAIHHLRQDTRRVAGRLRKDLDKNRKLVHDGTRHEVAKEGTASLANPGRIKRKFEDTEGFEDEE